MDKNGDGENGMQGRNYTAVIENLSAGEIGSQYWLMGEKGEIRRIYISPRQAVAPYGYLGPYIRLRIKYEDRDEVFTSADNQDINYIEIESFRTEERSTPLEIRVPYRAGKKFAIFCEAKVGMVGNAEIQVIIACDEEKVC